MEWERDEELIEGVGWLLEGRIASPLSRHSDEGFCHCEGITAGRGARVSKITLLLLANSPGNADASAMVGHAGRNVVDVGGFFESSEVPGIVLAPLGIIGSMAPVLLAHPLDGLLSALHTAVLSCDFGIEVGVQPSLATPVPTTGPGIKGCYRSKVFTHSVQDETGHPEMISHVDSFTGSYLEFPLGGHALGIQAGPVVSLHNIPTIHFVCSHTTVVWTLGPREATARPTEKVPIHAHKSIFLLHSKPGC